MAVLAHADAPRARHRVAAFFIATGAALAVFGASLIAPHKASLANLRDIPLTIAGIGCIDFAAFHLAHGWGWLVTGLSLVVLEHLIADEGGAR